MKGYLLVGMALFSNTVYATDYTKVTCTTEAARKMIMEQYNISLQNANTSLSVVDVYEMRITKRTEKLIECKGVMDYSTGEERIPATITMKDNSFGTPILTVHPIFDDDDDDE